MKEKLIRSENAKVWWNNFGPHASSAYYNILANAQLRAKSNDPESLGINVISYPLDFTSNDIDAVAIQQPRVENNMMLSSSDNRFFCYSESNQFKPQLEASTDTIVSICVVFALSFIPASFVVFLIEERACGAKHLQFLAGCHPVIYWTANYCWDMIIFMFPTALSIIIFLCFQVSKLIKLDPKYSKSIR